jgi:hypothetical protein
MRGLKLTLWAFVLGGAAALAAAGYFLADTRSFLARAQTANGVVVDISVSSSTRSTGPYTSTSSNSYSPVVEFAGPGGRPITFVADFGTTSSAYRRGEKVIVHYDPAQPENARLDGFLALWIGPTLTGGIGVAFFSIGSIALFLGRDRRRRNEWLKRNGARLETKFQSVERNKSLSIGGRNPFRIVSRWLDPSTNELHLFESENLWFDPTEFVRDPHIAVYVERGNPRRYYMDVSFLPKLAE